jgi:MFS family permease
MQMTILGWLVLELTDSPFLVALVGFFGWSPVIFLGLVGGVIADTANRKRVLVFTQFASLAAALVMMALLIMGSERFWHAYIVMMVTGAAFALDMPSRRSAIHDLLGSSGVTTGVALDSVGMSVSLMLGPALAGALITVVGFTGGFVVVSLAYFVSLTLVLRLRLPQGRRSRAGDMGLVRDLALGVRYVVGHRTLLAIVLITVLMNLLLYPYMNMVPVVARDVLHVGAGLMGVLQAAAGLGALTGAVVIASAINIRYPGHLFIGGSMLSLAALLLFSVSSWYLLSASSLLVLGLGTAGFTTMLFSMVMLVAREEMRGKALGVVSLAIGAGPLGALLVGAVANLRTPGFALGLNAVLGIFLIGLIGIFMQSLRRRVVPDERL